MVVVFAEVTTLEAVAAVVVKGVEVGLNSIRVKLKLPGDTYQREPPISATCKQVYSCNTFSVLNW